MAAQSSRVLSTLLSACLGVAALLAPAAGAQSDKGGAAFGGLQAFSEEHVSVRVEASDTRVAPGALAVIAVVLDHAPGWHVHTSAPVLPEAWQGAFYPVATTIEVTGEGVLPRATQWPEEHTILVDLIGSGSVEPYAVYEGVAVAYVPVLIDAAASGPIDVQVNVGYQACDDRQCDMPQQETLTVSLDVSPDGAAEPTLSAPLFEGFEVEAANEEPSDAGSTESSGGTRARFLGIIPLPSAGGAASAVVLALAGVVGGLVLNLTPCVLPVIPIKVLTISKHAGNPGRSLFLGTWMALGVVAFWIGIGLPVALFSSVTDPSRIFGIWWVTLGIGVVIGAMGVGIMGAFNITLPQKVYFINPKAETAWGSFVFGIMTAVLGLPCFGFVAGALLAGTATLGAPVIMLIFASLGVGMALPYFVLSLSPKLVDRIPRTGPASELVKQVMGLLLLAAAAYFVGAGISAFVKSDPVRAAELSIAAKTWHWWAIALLGAASGGWLAWKTLRITKKPVNRSLFVLTGLVIAGLGIAIALNRTNKIRNDFWIPYTEETLQAALDDGKVVVVDFTADWCLNCLFLKATVLEPDPVGEMLKSSGVIPFVADLTNTAAPGWDKLRDLGQTGIPALYVDGPGLDDPWIGNVYTAQQVREVIERASGKTAVAAR